MSAAEEWCVGYKKRHAKPSVVASQRGREIEREEGQVGIGPLSVAILPGQVNLFGLRPAPN